VHIISRKALRRFIVRHPDSQSALFAWYRILKMNQFATFVDLRRGFPQADLVGNLVVFNIEGNKYRLIVAIHFNRQKVYIRHVLTHAEYDRGGWKR
jgi:mRNA interferase HigB